MESNTVKLDLYLYEELTEFRRLYLNNNKYMEIQERLDKVLNQRDEAVANAQSLEHLRETNIVASQKIDALRSDNNNLKRDLYSLTQELRNMNIFQFMKWKNQGGLVDEGITKDD